jgi:hypothetical protein
METKRAFAGRGSYQRSRCWRPRGCGRNPSRWPAPTCLDRRHGTRTNWMHRRSLPRHSRVLIDCKRILRPEGGGLTEDTAWGGVSDSDFQHRWRAAERGLPTGSESMDSPTVQTLQDPILLPPWLCFRDGSAGPPLQSTINRLAALQDQAHTQTTRMQRLRWALPPCRGTYRLTS